MANGGETKRAGLVMMVLGITFLFILFFGMIANGNNNILGQAAIWAIGITGAAASLAVGITKD